MWLAWLAIAVGSTLQSSLHALIMDAGLGPVRVSAFSSLVEWGLWGLFTPAIIVVVRAIPPPGPGRWWAIPLLLAAGLTFAGLHALGASLVEELSPPSLREVPPTVPFVRHLALRASLYVGDSLAVFGIVAGVVYLIDHLDEQRAREVGISRLETRLAEAQLDALEAQLHPHFLFNTLNAVSALVEQDPVAAERALAQLGDLLRLTLSRRGHHRSELAEELQLTRRYLDLQRLRFGSRLRFELEVDPAAEGCEIPRLAVQGLVENAIKHGLRGQEPLTVTVRAFEADGDLTIEVSDDGRGPGTDGERSEGLGLGLESLQARIDHLYGAGRATLEAGPGESRGYSVRLRLPATSPDSP